MIVRTLATLSAVVGLRAGGAAHGQTEIAVDSRISTAYASATFGELPAELPITLAGTQILIDGIWVNGTGPYRFKLDTGGSGGGRVDAALAEKLGLEPVGTVMGSDGTGRPGREMAVYRLDEIKFGAATFRGVRAASRDYNADGAAFRGRIDGILGFQFFRELLLTLDLPNRKLRLASGSLPEPDGESVLATDPESYAPTIDVRLAGHRVRAHLDTGAMAPISVSSRLAKSLKMIGEPRAIGEARTVTGSFPISIAPLDGELRIGGHVVHEPDIVLGVPVRVTNIGGEILREFALTFDQVNHRVRIERPNVREIEGAPQRSRLGRKPIALPARVDNGHIHIDATINGKGPYPFLLDTGSGLLILTPSLVDELGLTSTGTSRMGDPSAPDAIEADEYVVDSLEIGGARFEKIDAASWSGPILEHSLGPARGIIGLPTFSRCLLTIDYPAREVRLSRGALGGGDDSIEFRWDDGIPTLDLQIGDVVIDAHLDTGNMGSIMLPKRIEDRLRFTSPPRVIGRGRTVSGEFDIWRAGLAGDIGFGGRTISNPEVNLTDRFDWANLGYGVLCDFAITVDQINRRMLFEESRLPGDSESVKPGKPKRYGFMAVPQPDGTIEVRGTLPGSLAERAGLKPGDLIKAVNGRDLLQISTADASTIMQSSPLRLTLDRDGKTVDIEMSHGE